MIASAHVRRDVPLGPLTTYKVGGSADLFAAPTTRDELVEVARAVRHEGLPVLVIGRGSNLLVSDDGFRGVVISLADLAGEVTIDGDMVTAGAAVPLPVLARRTAAAGLRGLEWMVGVPGSVGGAVRMNAGGHGSDLSSCLFDADVLDLVTGSVRRCRPDALGFRFRASALGDDEIVLDARFRVGLGVREEIEADLAEIVRWRREHQPGGQNAGSVFVNPVPGILSAGELIDRVGLRGVRVGSAHVSEKHANFIQADDGGSAADVLAVIETVRRGVALATGIVLRSEVRLVGFPSRTSAVGRSSSSPEVRS